MSHWDYRIMKREIKPEEFEFGICEVYYDDKEKIVGWTEKSMVPTCKSEQDLLFELGVMKEAFKKETLIYKEE